MLTHIVLSIRERVMTVRFLQLRYRLDVNEFYALQPLYDGRELNLPVSVVWLVGVVCAVNFQYGYSQSSLV